MFWFFLMLVLLLHIQYCCYCCCCFLLIWHNTQYREYSRNFVVVFFVKEEDKANLVKIHVILLLFVHHQYYYYYHNNTMMALWYFVALCVPAHQLSSIPPTHTYTAHITHNKATGTHYVHQLPGIGGSQPLPLPPPHLTSNNGTFRCIYVHIYKPLSAAASSSFA